MSGALKIEDAVNQAARLSGFVSPCLQLFGPDGLLITEVCGGGNSHRLDATLEQAGIHSILVYDYANDHAGDYSVTLECVSATCVSLPCILNLDLSYADSTLTMDFFAGTSVPATWNILGFVFNETYPYLSIPVPITWPPVSVSFSIPGLSCLGTIGVLTTLTTPEEGIICSDWETVYTCPLLAAEDAPTPGELKDLFKNYQEVPD